MPFSIFLLIFLLVPIAVLLVLLRRRLRPVHGVVGVVLTALILLYGTPWVNYVVASGIWGYSADLSLGLSFGYAPIEQYAFFALQAILTFLLTLLIWSRVDQRKAK